MRLSRARAQTGAAAGHMIAVKQKAGLSGFRLVLKHIRDLAILLTRMFSNCLRHKRRNVN